MNRRYEISFTSESGDSFKGGYWNHPPTYEEVMTALKICSEEEHDYIVELIRDKCWSKDFYYTSEVIEPDEPEIWIQ